MMYVIRHIYLAAIGLTSGGSSTSHLKRITGTLHVDRHTFMVISPSVLLNMINVLDKIRTENKKKFYVQ
jgi:hypothetical protein